jgi:hypothetical protein
MREPWMDMLSGMVPLMERRSKVVMGDNHGNEQIYRRIGHVELYIWAFLRRS